MVKVLAIIAVVIFAMSSIILGYLIGDSINEHKFWKRQNYMEKLNRKF